MRGFPIQTAEEREVEIDSLEEDHRDRQLLESAIDKIARKYDRLAPSWRAKQDENILMKLTIGELRVLKQFHCKFYDS